MPHLLSDNEKEKKIALLSIDALGDPIFAAKLAAAVGGSGSVSALQKIAASAEPEIVALAEASLGDLFGTMGASVVRVRSEGTVLSGFVVDSNGLVVTADYVVGDRPQHDGLVTLELFSGATAAAAVISVIPEAGLAFLRISDALAMDLPPLQVNGDDPSIGDEVVVLGYGDQGWRGAAARIVSRGEGFAVSRPGSQRLLSVPTYLTSAPISSLGDGGAPVLDQDRRLVGLVYAQSPATTTIVVGVETIRNHIPV